MFSILIPYQCSTFHSPSTLSDPELHDHLHDLNLCIHITSEHMAQVLHHIVDQLACRWTPGEDGKLNYFLIVNKLLCELLEFASQMDVIKLVPNILGYGYSKLF